MIIGIPKEVKNHEYRVGATPALVNTLVRAGHVVKIETKAGEKIGFLDKDYEAMGATIVSSAKEAWDVEMVVKVKEPQHSEFDLMKEGLVLFTFLHLAAEPELTKALIEKKITAIAYETVTDHKGQLPLLIPMSEIAGRVAIQAGATTLQLSNGGKGILLGGVPGVHPANVIIIGGGVVGINAARMAMGLGANVTILDKNLDRLRQLDEIYGSKLRTLYSTPQSLREAFHFADLVVGSVLIPGKSAPKLVTRDMVQMLEPGSVLVDVAIDQGGCMETSRPTSHDKPTYILDDVVHYCVTNIPGVCARTATEALINATSKYVLFLANKGYKKALLSEPGLLNGLNVYQRKITNKFVAEDLDYEYFPAETLL